MTHQASAPQHPNPSGSIRIGPVQLPNRVFLAPMSGITDLPFRKLAQRLGAGLVVSEMIASKLLINNGREELRRIQKGGERPFVVQLAGREAHWMAQGARIAADQGADIIDINMGCPAKQVQSNPCQAAEPRSKDPVFSASESRAPTGRNALDRTKGPESLPADFSTPGLSSEVRRGLGPGRGRRCPPSESSALWLTRSRSRGARRGWEACGSDRRSTPGPPSPRAVRSGGREHPVDDEDAQRYIIRARNPLLRLGQECVDQDTLT